MPDFLKSEEQVINVGDVAIKKKTPSRTYIQMWVKLIEAGKMRVSKSVYKQLKECSELLDEHPELVEHVVRRRVEVILFVRRSFLKMHIHEPSIITWETMAIKDWKAERGMSMAYWDNECCPY